jgi:hypothetical protein
VHLVPADRATRPTIGDHRVRGAIEALGEPVHLEEWAARPGRAASRYSAWPAATGTGSGLRRLPTGIPRRYFAIGFSTR